MFCPTTEKPRPSPCVEIYERPTCEMYLYLCGGKYNGMDGAEIRALTYRYAKLCGEPIRVKCRRNNRNFIRTLTYIYIYTIYYTFIFMFRRIGSTHGNLQNRFNTELHNLIRAHSKRNVNAAAVWCSACGSTSCIYIYMLTSHSQSKQCTPRKCSIGRIIFIHARCMCVLYLCFWWSLSLQRRGATAECRERAHRQVRNQRCESHLYEASTCGCAALCVCGNSWRSLAINV